MVAKVEAETAVRVESLQVRVNNHHGYQRKKCSQPQCKNVSRGKGVCVRHGHILKKCNTDGCNNRAQRKGICKTTAVVVSAWLMVVCWQSSKD
jgi:hypothetical protein